MQSSEVYAPIHTVVEPHLRLALELRTVATGAERAAAEGATGASMQQPGLPIELPASCVHGPVGNRERLPSPRCGHEPGGNRMPLRPQGVTVNSVGPLSQRLCLCQQCRWQGRQHLQQMRAQGKSRCRRPCTLSGGICSCAWGC